MDYLQEQLTRAGKYEVMMNSEGWDLVMKSYTDKLSDLANRIFTSDGDISVFQHEVDEIRGLRKLLNDINHDIEVLHEQRQQPESTGTAEPTQLE